MAPYGTASCWPAFLENEASVYCYKSAVQLKTVNNAEDVATKVRHIGWFAAEDVANTR